MIFKPTFTFNCFTFHSVGNLKFWNYIKIQNPKDTKLKNSPRRRTVFSDPFHSSRSSPMDDESGSDPGSYSIPPASVHLASFVSPVRPPSIRRLSTQFTRRCQPLQSSWRLAYLSLQGLLVNSDEASSARSIGGGLSREESLAWELFTPYQRFLIVAVIGVAAAESKKNCVIRQLQNSVDLRVRISSLYILLRISEIFVMIRSFWQFIWLKKFAILSDWLIKALWLVDDFVQLCFNFRYFILNSIHYFCVDLSRSWRFSVIISQFI